VAGAYATVSGMTSSATCSQCWAGTFSTGSGMPSSVACTACVAGTFLTGLGAPAAASCQACIAGTYSGVVQATNSSVCTNCSAGSYSATTGASQASACTACPLVTYSNQPGGASLQSCLPCATGFYTASTGSTACAGCGAGSYSTNGSNCFPCPAHSFTPAGISNATSLKQCLCVAGYVGDVSLAGCVACPINYYCAGGAANLSAACPAGTFTLGGAGLVSQCVCTANAVANVSGCGCVPGYVQVTNASNLGGWQCNPCPANSYCLYGGQTACPTNSTSPALSQGVSQCACNAGYAFASGVCVGCPVGTYSLGGALACTACPANSNTSGLAAGSQSLCLCVAGYVGPPGGPCPQCAPNWYCPGAAANLSVLCPLGQYSLAGASAAGQCGCPASASLLPPPSNCTCNAGYQKAANASSLGGWQCNPCPPGSYCSLGVYTACPASSTSPALSQSLSQCVCNAGYFWNATLSACPLCPYNSYCLAGMLAACPSNTTSVQGSRLQTDCQCVAGFQCIVTQDYQVQLVFVTDLATYASVAASVRAQLAAAAGVPVSAVIVNTTVQSGARRLLEVRGYVPVPAWYEHDLAPV